VLAGAASFFHSLRTLFFMALLEVKVPPMGESISTGILAQWHVADGAIVKKDQPLFELETDKITSEGTAEEAGKIALKAAAGDEVKIGQVVATIDTAVVEESAPPPAPAPAAAPSGPGGGALAATVGGAGAAFAGAGLGAGRGAAFGGSGF